MSFDTAYVNSTSKDRLGSSVTITVGLVFLLERLG